PAVAHHQVQPAEPRLLDRPAQRGLVLVGPVVAEQDVRPLDPRQSGHPACPFPGRAPVSRTSPGPPARQDVGTGTTGQREWCRTAWFTRPSAIPIRLLRGRAPTTTSAAFSDASTSARCAVRPDTTGWTVASGQTPVTPATAAASSMLSMSGGRGEPSPPPACGATAPTPRQSASAKAHRPGACSPGSPLTPSTTCDGASQG